MLHFHANQLINAKRMLFILEYYKFSINKISKTNQLQAYLAVFWYVYYSIYAAYTVLEVKNTLQISCNCNFSCIFVCKGYLYLFQYHMLFLCINYMFTCFLYIDLIISTDWKYFYFFEMKDWVIQSSNCVLCNYHQFSC
jgi:hypothetical protein